MRSSIITGGVAVETGPFTEEMVDEIYELITTESQASTTRVFTIEENLKKEIIEENKWSNILEKEHQY